MKFTLKQLFSIVDGRLSTSMEDLYAILNHATGENLMTHELPVASKYFSFTKPDWYKQATKDLDRIKLKIGNNFNGLMFYISDNKDIYYDVKTLSSDQKKVFKDFMAKNRIL